MYVLVKNQNGEARVRGLKQALEFCGCAVPDNRLNYLINQLKCNHHPDSIKGLQVDCGNSQVEVTLDCCCDGFRDAVVTSLESSMAASCPTVRLVFR